MGNSDIGQLANQAVLQIPRKHEHTHITRAKQKLKRQNYHTRLPFQYFTLQCISSDTQTTICGLLVGVVLVSGGGRVSTCVSVYVRVFGWRSLLSKQSLWGEKRGRQETQREAGNLWPQWEVPIQLLPACLTLSLLCSACTVNLSAPAPALKTTAFILQCVCMCDRGRKGSHSSEIVDFILKPSGRPMRQKVTDGTHTSTHTLTYSFSPSGRQCV